MAVYNNIPETVLFKSQICVKVLFHLLIFLNRNQAEVVKG